jgi:murein L,D-transpeptidase YafK
MIHGLPNRLGFIGVLHRLIDWTEGCIAVANGEIEDIWARVGVGTPIEIRE